MNLLYILGISAFHVIQTKTDSLETKYKQIFLLLCSLCSFHTLWEIAENHCRK